MLAPLYLMTCASKKSLGLLQQCVLNSPACPDDFQIRELLQWFKQASSQQRLPDFPEGDTR
jgi:hypothetical protein